MPFSVIIPARYASIRLPGKPLRMIGDSPMIRHVYDRARESGAARIIIATDDERIRDCAREFGAEVLMTSPHHRSGTERAAEVAALLELDDEEIIVNLQGDEPMMPAAVIHQVAENLDTRPEAAVATVCVPIGDTGEFFDPHVVKVVCDSNGYALYFSRAPIPWHRDAFDQPERVLPDSTGFNRHIGLYAYRVGLLNRYTAWPHCEIENIEALEQLRVLWHGGRIHVDIAVETPGPGVDTEEDLERVRAILPR